MEEGQNKIEKIEGVISSRIVGEGNEKEIHVIADKTRDPKRIVRDIETIFQVEMGREIDHKKISIARIERDETERYSRRLELISVHQEKDKPCFHYKFSLDGQIIEEKISGSLIEGEARLAALGMLELLEKYDLIEGCLRLKNVQIIGFNTSVILVEIQLFRGRHYQSGVNLLGSVYINNNLPLAASKACLKALNRLIQ